MTCTGLPEVLMALFAVTSGTAAAHAVATMILSNGSFTLG
jgi:hypothetical protein